MSIEIRKAEIKDAAKIVEFQIAMAAETESKTLEKPIVETAVSAVFQDQGKGFYLVVCDGDVAVGSLMITFEWSDWRNSNIWYIQSVYIEPDFRGRKLFSRMFESVKNMASVQKVKFIRLYVEKENSHAQKVYESLGMQQLPYLMYDISID